MPQQPIELILLRQWASYLAMPVIVAGSDHNVAYYNEAAEALAGLPLEEAGELPVERLSTMFQMTAEDGSPLSPDDLPLSLALQERKPSHRRLRYLALDGVWRLVDVTAFPVEGQEGRHLGAAAIFWEVKA